MVSSEGRQNRTEQLSMRRRLKSVALVLISQMMLVALAIAWLIHMAIIAAYGSIAFVEDNPFILWAEITASGLIMIFGIYVLVVQIKRLGERRSGDRSQSPAASSTSRSGRPMGAFDAQQR